MIERELPKLWQDLQGKKQHLSHHLNEVRISNIRGIGELRVQFDYPVGVIAGGNASGKSTVLFAAACAYRVPGAGVRDFVPSTLFPDYRPKAGDHRDERRVATLEFDYSTSAGRLSMRWRRMEGWNRSFFGRRGASQPERPVYLRTVANLSNPSEARGILQMSRRGTPPRANRLTASQISFAQRILPFRYAAVVNLVDGRRSLLFAQQESGDAYSELHMSAGERAILRFSQEIAQLRGALVLVDDVETGLHPWVQQLLMLHLQWPALRNDLQVIVTTHSPVVIDSVPTGGRIFLDRREDGNVVLLPPHRDIVQSALYGRSQDRLNLLCEDKAAEAVLNGVLDHLVPRLGVKRDSVRVGRDTGASEFPSHAAAFRKFGLLDRFVFVLDGDQTDGTVEGKLRERADSRLPVLYLPGRRGPEAWVWKLLAERGGEFAQALSEAPDRLATEMNRIDGVYAAATDGPAEVARTKLRELAMLLDRDAAEVCRIVSRLEAQDPGSEIQPLVEQLTDILTRWRNEG